MSFRSTAYDSEATLDQTQTMPAVEIFSFDAVVAMAERHDDSVTIRPVALGRAVGGVSIVFDVPSTH